MVKKDGNYESFLFKTGMVRGVDLKRFKFLIPNESKLIVLVNLFFGKAVSQIENIDYRFPSLNIAKISSLYFLF